MSFNTGNPLPSKDILDLYDNSENIDQFVNSQQDEIPDRFGVKRLTLAGLIKRSMVLRNEINDFSGAMTFKPEWSDVPMNVSVGVGGEGGALNLQAEALGNRSEINKIISREALRRSCAEAGYALVTGSFEAGGTLVKANDVLLQESTGKAFSGPAGNVSAGTNPTLPSSGYVSRTDVVLRNELAAVGGAELVYWSHLNGLSVSMTVASRLRKKVYASDYGVTELTTPEFNRQALQAVMDDTATAGAAAVFDVSCSISGMLVIKPNLALFTPRHVTIKVADGVDSGVMQGSSPDLKNIYIEGGTFDGNQQNAPRLVARSVFDFGIVDGFVIDGVTVKNGSGYGFAFQAREHTGAILAYRGHASNIVIRNSKSQNNGVGIAAGGDTYDGFDFKYVDGCILDNCLASGNSDAGFDIRGYRSFFNNCQAISNGGRGFAFGASYSDTGYPIKGSVWVNNLLADGNALSGFFFGEGLTANEVRYSVNGQGLFAIGNASHAFRVEAQNADIVVSGLELRGSPTAFYVTQTGVSSLNVSQLLVRDCSGIGIVVDPTVVGPIQLSNIDVLAGTYGASLYSPTQVIFNGGRLTGVANGPIRVDATAAIPVLNGIVDGVITYKKGDVVSNSSSTLTLKLGLDKVIVSSTSTINNISPMIEGREVTIVASGSLTFQNSSAIQVQVSPVTITDGNLIKLVAINGKWRQV